MKRYLTYICVALMACTIPSCARVEMDSPADDNVLTVIGRVTSFTNTDVSTKGNKVGDEKKISNMTMFVIDGNGDVVNTPDYQSGDSEYIFTVDRNDYDSRNQTAMADAHIYIFANIPEDQKATLISIRTLQGLMELDLPVIGIKEPEIGFPMIGQLDIDLSTASTETGEKQIPLKALYAKVVFTINVDPIQFNPAVTQRFQMKKWTVYNVPDAVRVGTPDDDAETANAGSMQTGDMVFSDYTGSNPASSAHTMSFSFYMPEHKINPEGSVTYPFADTPENAQYKQQFKPALVKHGTAEAQNATYVVIDGDFYDHNGRRHAMSYTIYLGGNNYDNFHILRDHQYNNYITIRGVSNSTSEDEGTVSYDWRVEKEQTNFKFELERETLLDSHWEIRPIRITLDAAEHPGSKIIIRIPNPSTADWIRMEMPDNPGADVYCTKDANDLAYGKRKYFTTDLVTNTLSSGTEFTILADPDKSEHTIWVYIDEYANTTAGNVTRQAALECNYYDRASDEVAQITEVYNFIQKNIHSVTNNGNNYFIEYYEEYLYNFDSREKYDGTTDGMKWGLENVELSKDHSVVALNNVTGGGNASQKAQVTKGINNLPLKYDFYMSRDIDNNNLGLSPREDRNGLEFTKEIGQNNKSGIGKLSTNKPANSAVEYCLNKNTRKADGTIDYDHLHWYLPAIDEIEEICKGGYTEFDVFQDKLYWSSQPAFKRGLFEYYDRMQDAYYLPYYKEDSGVDLHGNVTYGKGRARATKVDDMFRNVKSESYGIQHATSAVGSATNNSFSWPQEPAYYECYPGHNISYTGRYRIVVTLHTFNLVFNWNNPSEEQLSVYKADGVWPSSADHYSYTISGNNDASYSASWKDWYYFYDEGNCSRDEVHRIRCAYKD